MKYDLVFQGGGARGMVLVGAYQEFVRRGHTAGRLLGTSAGAITATLIAAGYTPAEMLIAMEEQEHGRPVFAGFLGHPSPFSQEEIRSGAIRAMLRNIDLKLVPEFIEVQLDDAMARMLVQDPLFCHLVSLIERGGWYSADRFLAWMQARLESGQWKGEGRRFSQMTLAQFFEATRAELAVVATDTTDGRLLVLNHNTAPQCPLLWAVRMSMSIPLLWEEVTWRASWGTYLGRDMTGHTVVDGGLLSNFPLELLISDAPQVTRLMGPKRDDPVLGMLIDDTLPVPAGLALGGALVDVNVKPGELRTVRRLTRLVDTALNAHDKMVSEAFSHLVVRLPAQGYGVVEFDMSDERRAALVAGGVSAMSAYFDLAEAGPAVLGGAAPDPLGTADRIATRLLEQG